MRIWIVREKAQAVQDMGYKLRTDENTGVSFVDTMCPPCDDTFPSVLPPEVIIRVTERGYFKQRDLRISPGVYEDVDGASMVIDTVSGHRRDDGMEFHHNFSVSARTVVALERLYAGVRAGQVKPAYLWDVPPTKPMLTQDSPEGNNEPSTELH